MRLEAADYFGGRDVDFAGECTPVVRDNAAALLERVNALLLVMLGDGLELERNARGTLVNSGWRPALINGQVKGAAPRSKHMSGQAIDLYDPEGRLDDWCMDHLDVLEGIGLWMEHPSATKGWLHLQNQPPASGKRVFYP